MSGGASYCGTLFGLSPSESGWTFTVLHTFTGGKDDGCGPSSDLFLGGGNYGNGLLGTTGAGGPADDGTVFEFSSGTDHIVSFWGTNGDAPTGLGLSGWAVYGTTYAGGRQAGEGGGVVFEWSFPPNPHIKYKFSTTGKAGFAPCGDLAMQFNADGLGIMYGTTSQGGAGNNGTVYQLTQRPSDYPEPPFDTWAISVPHSFSGADGDGANPYAGVVLDTAGNLYGTTVAGGADPGYAGTAEMTGANPTPALCSTMLGTSTARRIKEELIIRASFTRSRQVRRPRLRSPLRRIRPLTARR